MLIFIKRRLVLKDRAQGIVEFALILPLLLFLIFGIFEFGRILFLMAVVHTSSREAARYGTASGENSSSVARYQDCAGIRAAALRIGGLAGITPNDITVSYDNGTSSSTYATCPVGGIGPTEVASGSRITININASISPILPIPGIPTIPISASTSRTILSDISIFGTPPAPGTEPQPSLYFTISDSPIIPEGDSLTVEVRLSYAIQSNVTFDVSVAGSASSDDYLLSPLGTVTIPAGSIRTFLTFQAKSDTINDEPLEDVIIILNNPTNAILGTPSSYTIWISDVYVPPEVSFITDQLQVSESGKSGILIVQLSHPTSRDLTIPLSVSGTATRDLSGDYTIVPLNSLWIQAGYKYASIVVNIYNDPIDEYDETVIVTLGEPADAVLVNPTTCTLTILDDDDPPNVHFTKETQEVMESAGSVKFAVQLSIESGKTITVPVTFAGTALAGGVDYLYSEGSIIIPPGQTQVEKSIQISDDLIDEYDETIEISLGPPINAVPDQPDKQTITIIDNDSPPDVFLYSSQKSISEGSPGMNVEVKLNYPSGKAIVVRLTTSGTATQGVDYNLSSNQVTINPGEMSGAIWLSILEDSLDEDNETISVEIASAQHGDIGTPSSQIISLEDNDEPPLVSFSTSNIVVGESNGPVVISVRLSKVSGRNVQINLSTAGSAIVGEDYALETTQVIIPSGSTTANITISILDDPVYEGDENLVVSIGELINGLVGDPSSVAITIVDNDSGS